MGQHELDNEFKTKLNGREIQPSAHAWERLDAMLNEAKGKKIAPLRKLNWLYIAAGILGFILIASMFFTQGKKDKAQTEVAIEEKAPEKANPENKLEEIIPAVKNKNQVADVKTETQKETVNQPQPKHSQQPDRKMPFQKSESAIASADKKQNQSINNNQQSINQKPDLEKANASVDELLASATLNPQSSKKPSLKVDANLLLSQVDGELELSFREKVISTVSKKFQKVKVAVADRNQE
jgi:type IV secretory pathway VirB10-like protein